MDLVVSLLQDAGIIANSISIFIIVNWIRRNGR